jgi:DNA-binding NarL/FixJ family response regulator
MNTRAVTTALIRIPTAIAKPTSASEGEITSTAKLAASTTPAAVTDGPAVRSAIDPQIVGRMLGRRRHSASPLDDLTPREREVLAAMAEGKSNLGIAEALVVSEAAVEKHITAIFQKLGIAGKTTEHRRVLAVLTYMRNAGG